MSCFTHMRSGLFVLYCIALLLPACRQTAAPPPGDTLFTSLPASYTGLQFENTLRPTEEFNAYTYRNFYNGAGVGLGDVNNDGLVDIYFCGNMVENKLYLNRGNMRFEDVTHKAGVACPGVWSSGVSMADVNGDGWLDIYVCKSGKPGGENRYNELFINSGKVDDKGVPVFTEQAKQWGIADMGLSSHAVFFDYDLDGDLDCYLLNNSMRSVGGYDLRPGQRNIRDTLGGNKLYRHEGDHFTDVSEAAGIYGSAIGFGLGVTIGDVNRDGWPDIYVSNDYFERDYLYLNNQRGGFEERLESCIRETSLSAMGADMADLNNDGWPEIFVTDMLPSDEARIKTKTVFESWDKYQLNLRNGYYRQFTRNTLQQNNGPAPGDTASGPRNVYFSETGRMAGVHASDWSWGALIFDMDNDGLKDIFVANGIYKDLTDQDYIQYYGDPRVVQELIRREKNAILKMVSEMPSEPVPDCAFRNEGGLQFSDYAASWGLGTPGFSNGSAYADLDNDGDLDLVVNVVNAPARFYRSEARQLHPEHNYLSLSLEGMPGNTRAIGASATLWAGDTMFFQEIHPMRGFLSCVDTRMLFGLGKHTRLDSLRVQWPGGKQSFLTDLRVNQALRLQWADAQPAAAVAPELPRQRWLSPLKAEGLDLPHIENEFNDFDRDRLLFHMLSHEGPGLAIADVNGDGLDDVFISGAKGQPGQLWMQMPAARFVQKEISAFEADKTSEDVAACFFDADGDGDADLFVCGGGYELPSSSFDLASRLYFNDGKGNFSRSPQLLPAGRYESASCVAASDFDGDGDLDLVVGLRLQPFQYGLPAGAYLLENNGKGVFSNVTQARAPELAALGMVTDACWADIDRDGDSDLLVVGEWMQPVIFRNEKSRLTKLPAELPSGLWNSISAADLDLDGYPDFILGNHGTNTRLRASREKPLELFVHDFDHNGSLDHILCAYNGDKSYPLALRHDLITQIPSLRKKYLKYNSYKLQTARDIFGEAELSKALRLIAEETRSGVLMNRAGSLHFEAFPAGAQLAPVFAAWTADLDGDRYPEIVLGGNFLWAKPEAGAYASSYGTVLKRRPSGLFEAVNAAQSGFMIEGEIRAMAPLRVGGLRCLLVARNNDSPRLFQLNP